MNYLSRWFNYSWQCDIFERKKIKTLFIELQKYSHPEWIVNLFILAFHVDVKQKIQRSIRCNLVAYYQPPVIILIDWNVVHQHIVIARMCLICGHSVSIIRLDSLLFHQYQYTQPISLLLPSWKLNALKM